MKHSDPPRYGAYVVRCWEVRSTRDDGATTWRFSVEDSRTGERHGFAGVDDLLGYLRDRLATDQEAQTQALD